MDSLERIAQDIRARLQPEIPKLDAIAHRSRVLRRRRRATTTSAAVLSVIAVAVAGFMVADPSRNEPVATSDSRGSGEVGQSDPITVGQVRLPDGVVPADVASVSEEIAAAVDERDQWTSPVPTPADTVHLDLKPGREQIAAALLDRYGSRVDVTVGGLPWPRTGTVASPDGCDVRLDPDATPGLSATLMVASPQVPIGEDIVGSVVLHNDSEASVRVDLHGGFARAFLVDLDSRLPVGVYSNPARAGSIASYPVEPGEVTRPLSTVAGAAACDQHMGTAVQPGDYELVALLTLRDGREVLSEFAPVEIVNRQMP